MPAKKPSPTGQRPQSEDFIETARQIETDESREAFEALFKKITKDVAQPKEADRSLKKE